MSTRRLAKVLNLLFAISVFVPLATLSSVARTEQLLHTFNYNDGTHPYGALILDAAGNLYGTTSQDGPTGAGTVYELATNGSGQWEYETIYSFCSVFTCSDGIGPQSGLIMDSAGNLYGTTSMGGNNNYPCGHGCGTVFELTSHNGLWTETVLYAFTGGNDGGNPLSGLAIDSAGNLYGTTSIGGGTSTYCTLGCGVLFTLQRGSNGIWIQKVLHSFCSADGCADGADPNSVAFDAAGNLYCTTARVGVYDGGTLLQLVPRSNGTWTGHLVHSFGKGKDGISPNPGLAFDASGNIYGTTNQGGGTNWGIAFELSLGTNGRWRESLLHSFCSAANENCSDGGLPSAGLTIDSSGRLFGTTTSGGSHFGVLYVLTQNPNGHWIETVLNTNSFTGNLDAQVTIDGSGNLYTTTANGGDYDLGSVFEIMP
jgi:uncharacterized repeat protein (TIGR03803 family)